MAADIDSNLANWSTTASSNQPDATDSILNLDDNLQQIQAVVRKYLATKGSDIASASTVNLATATGNYVHVTGTTTVTALGTVAAGMRYMIVFDGALTLTHNATSLILPGGANITTAAGDRAEFVSLGSGNWRCMWYQKASGIPIDSKLSAIAALAVTDGNIIVGDGSTWVAETGDTARTSLGLAIGTDVQAYDADTLKADTADVLTAGFAATPYSLTWSGTITLNEANGNLQYATNNAAVTLNPPSNSCTLILQVTNGASAGAVTTSGFTKVTGAFTTTNGDDFMCYITKVNTFSHLHITALQ